MPSNDQYCVTQNVLSNEVGKKILAGKLSHLNQLAAGILPSSNACMITYFVTVDIQAKIPVFWRFPMTGLLKSKCIK